MRCSCGSSTRRSPPLTRRRNPRIFPRLPAKARAAADAELVGFAGGFTDGEYGYVVPSAYAKAARVPVVKHALPALPRWTSPDNLPPLPEDYRDDLEDFTRRLAEEAAADRPRELDEDE